jgi:CubicO group peptidase (beta-lactamase class C family)
VWSRGFGFADTDTKTPPTPDTLYRVASISKLFTATAVMQLRDAGKLRLDDPVTAYLPWFAIKSEHTGSVPITGSTSSPTRPDCRARRGRRTGWMRTSRTGR